jgi:hypothetical protein
MIAKLFVAGVDPSNDKRLWTVESKIETHPFPRIRGLGIFTLHLASVIGRRSTAFIHKGRRSSWYYFLRRYLHTYRHVSCVPQGKFIVYIHSRINSHFSHVFRHGLTVKTYLDILDMVTHFKQG